MSKSAEITHGKIKAVIFDFSGTMFHDRPSTWKIVNDVFSKFKKKKISLKKFREEFRLPYYGIFVKHGVEEDLAKKVALETYHERYPVYEHLVRPFDDTIFCIETLLKMGFRVGIVSQTPREELNRQLEKFGLEELVPFSVALREASEEKPQPMPLFLCMEKLGVDPDQTIYVGDMFEDVLCARNARVIAVVVDNQKRSYHTSKRLQEAKPDYVISNLRQLIDLLSLEKVAVMV